MAGLSLSPATIELLGDGLRCHDSHERADYLAQQCRPVASDASSSKQARHARLVRCRTSAVVAALALVAREDDFFGTLFSPDFARLRPLSAQYHSPLLHLVNTRGVLSITECQTLWERARPRLFDLADRAHERPDEETLVLSSLLTCLYEV